MNHVCRLTMSSKASGLLMSHRKPLWYFKMTSLSEKHPKTSFLFRSISDREKEILKHLKSKNYLMIHPFSSFRLYWEFFMYCVFFASFIILPLNVVRHKIPRGYSRCELSYLGVSTVIIDILCFMDMFVTFQTGFHDGRMTVMNKKMIKINYLKSIYFITDLLSSLPIEIWDMVYTSTISLEDDKTEQFERTIINYFHLLSLLKICRIKTLVNYGYTVCHILKLTETGITACRIVNVVIVYVHWFGCLNFIIPMFISSNTSSHYHWMWTMFDRQPELGELYYACFFRAISILTATSSTEFRQRNNMEGIISCVGLVMAAVLNGVILIVIISVCINKSATVVNYAIYKDQVQKYMIGKDLKMDLQKRVIEYIDYTYEGLYFNEKNVKEILSQKLMEDIAIYRGQKMLQGTILLQLPHVSMRHVFSHMKEETVTPNDNIIKSGTKGTCMYFIASGTVVVKSPAGKEICHLESGEYFGEISLVIKGQRRTADVQALEYCSLFRLDKKTFQTQIAMHDNIMQELKNMAMERMAITEKLNAMHLQLLSEMQKVKTLENEEY